MVFRKTRFVAAFLLLAAGASTGSLLASDGCKLSLVKTAVSSSQAADRLIAPRHKHTKAVLAAWQQWGANYLATHGHPYVPPKRTWKPAKMLHKPGDSPELQLECEPIEVATNNQDVPTLLTGYEPDSEFPEFISGVDQPALIPAPITTAAPVDSPPGFYVPPFYPVNGGGSSSPSPSTPVTNNPTPPVTTPTPPVTVTPEPASYVYLSTGLAALAALRFRRRRA